MKINKLVLIVIHFFSGFVLFAQNYYGPNVFNTTLSPGEYLYSTQNLGIIRQIEMVHIDLNFTRPNNKVTFPAKIYSFSDGNQTSFVTHNFDSGLRSEIIYTYDDNGTLTTLSNSDGARNFENAPEIFESGTFTLGADTDPNRYEYDLQISESTVHLIIKSYRNNKIYNYNEKLWVFNESDKLIQKWDITRIKYKLSNLDDICFISFFEYDSDGRIIEVNELRTNQESNADNILDEFSIKENDFVKRIEFEYSEDLINRVLQYDGNELNSYYYYSNFDNMGNWRTVTQKNLDGEIINIWNRDIIYN